MQLGFVSAIVPELSLDDVLKLAADIGYDCVEMMCWPVGKAERRYAGVTHINVDDLGPSHVNSVRAAIERTGVTLSGLGYYPNALSADMDESTRSAEHIKKVIAACPKLGLTRMNTFIGRNPKLSVDENWPRFLEVWPAIIQHAEALGVRVGIENCPMSFTNDEWPGGKNLATTPAIWRRMFAAIPSDHFGLNYDPSHCVWQQMDYVRPMAEFRSKLFHIHAKDVSVDRDRLNDVGILATPLEYHAPKLPGLGDVNWGRFFSQLSGVGYRGSVCVEVEDRAYEDSLESRVAALVQSHTYLRQFVPRRKGRA